MRMAKAVSLLGIPETSLEVMTFPEDQKVDPFRVEERLKDDRGWTNVGIVHSETTSGVINPIGAVGNLVKQCCPSMKISKRTYSLTCNTFFITHL